MDVVVALPGRWAPTGSGEGLVGPHAATSADSRLIIRPASGTRYIEQVLADLFLGSLGDKTPEWLKDWESGRLTAAAADDVLAVSGPTLSRPSWVDRYLFSADLSHRLLFERRWDHERPATCVWVLINPGTRDLMQDKDGQRRGSDPGRGNLGVAIGRTQSWAAKPPSNLADWGEVGSVTIVNLFTARSASLMLAGRTLPTVGAVTSATQVYHRAADRVLRRAVTGAAAAVGAWGSSGPSKLGSHRPRQVERLISDTGVSLFGVAGTRGGRTVRWLTNGQPRYTQGMPADAYPIPLAELRADTSLPLP